MNKILIADDSRLIISLVKNIFQQQSNQYIVITALDGNEAVEQTITESPDLILMDWQMPGMSGVDALRVLKSNNKTKDIPVIMLTASDNIAIAYDNGATDFIQKPFDRVELLARVNSALSVVNSTNELKRRNIEIEIQREKLKMQKDMLVKQKKELSTNLTLASNVQSDITISDDDAMKFFNNAFVLSLPKENIVNNFLWIRKKETTIYFAVAYCTRHGISSVLINLFSNLCLDNIISGETKPLQPAQMLSQFQAYIDRAVCFPDATKNCVNIAICALDVDKKTLQYAGANVPVYVIKNKKLVELKTDTMQANKGDVQFTNHKVQLAENDLIYLLNDGFNEHQVDAAGRNYISDEISDVLLKIFAKDLKKQKELLLKTFTNWKKDLKQVEDILVLGVKI
jgi:sigma-B regulation protein RsbU (phosphoserine phosphatase)